MGFGSQGLGFRITGLGLGVRVCDLGVGKDMTVRGRVLFWGERRVTAQDRYVLCSKSCDDYRTVAKLCDDFAEPYPVLPKEEVKRAKSTG